MRFIHLRTAAPALHRHLNLTGRIKEAHQDGDEEAKGAGFHVTPGDTGRGAAL